MKPYASVIEIAEKWDVTPRRVQILCRENRVEGAIKQCGVWLIPRDAKKPKKNKLGMRSESRKIKVLSLFSGCGGMDLGFEGGFRALKKSVNKKVHPEWETISIDENWCKLGKNSFETVFANDIKPEAKATWVNYFGKRGADRSIYCLGSIVDLVKLEKENKMNIFPKNIDVVTGGFPCQDFSIAGKRLGFESNKAHTGGLINANAPTTENRGQLYMWMREVISIVQPKVFVAENVKGLTNLENAKTVIENDFASVCNGGYIVVPAKVLNAAEYGVPQGRERVIFYGFKRTALNREALSELTREVIRDEYDPYPKKTHYIGESVKDRIRFVSSGEALIGLQEPDKANDVDQRKYSKAKYMGSHCQGQQEIKLDGLSPTIRSEHHGNIEFRRLSKEHGGTHKEELCEGMMERRLTIRECARIQTFPDDYEFVIPATDYEKSVSVSEAYKIIGNAVPPLLAYHIASRLETNWELYFGGRNG